MVLCVENCCCEYCYLIKVYEHPRFKRDIQNMIEMYKSMADSNYFPIEVETEVKESLIAEEESEKGPHNAVRR